MHWTVNGTDREAMVYIPATAKTQATPVIFAFHGHGGTARNMFQSRGFEQLWAEAIVVCPQGLNTPGQLTDPQGTLPGWQKGPGDMNDRDLFFFDAMLNTMRQEYKVDDKRIYATGHSNGGGFTYLLWAMRSDVFAAVAPSAAVAGRLVNLLKPLPAMATLYSSSTGTPAVLYVHPGGHVYPPEANAVVIKFFKSETKP